VALFNGNKSEQPTTTPPPSPAPPSPPAVDWSNIENIRGEWPRAALDPATDLQRYRQALALYERDDYASMMQCATMFATALAHSLYGPGILRGDELRETLHKALYCSLCAPPDGRTFADTAQKAARLAMTIMRENGWQPPSLGGTNTHFERMMMDKGNYILVGTAISPPNQPWAGDLKAFFAVPPQPTIGTLPNPESDRGGEMIDRIYTTIQESKAGDTASSLYVAGMALSAQGDVEGALAKYSEAARVGSVDAMAAAGDLSADLGRQEDANFWYEGAANAGHPVGMFNTAIVAIQKGDRTTAQQWFQRSAEAGNAEGYAALTQMADQAGDETAEAHWARLGAEAGHIFCMGRHGLLLARGANGDVPRMRRARDVLEQAADRGHLDSASLAINLNHQLNDAPRAQRFVTMVVKSGDAEAIDRLRRFGFL
jgi:tetratricopeptide (TPR) repeat protein